MNNNFKAATDEAYRRGYESGYKDGRRTKWVEIVRLIGVVAGELYQNQEAQRVLHLVQERLANSDVSEAK